MTATLDLSTALPALREEIERVIEAKLAARATAPLDDHARLWAGAPTLRLSVKQLAAALGRSPRYVYRLVKEGLPSRTRDDVLVFVVGEVREWLTARERLTDLPADSSVLPLRRHSGTR